MKVVRIAHLHEFHITDEDALLRAAVDRGWEPLPASELDDDPRDLIEAVMTLTECERVGWCQWVGWHPCGGGYQRSELAVSWLILGLPP